MLCSGFGCASDTPVSRIVDQKCTCNAQQEVLTPATYLVNIFEELLLLLMVKGVGMRYIAQCILALQSRKHNLIFCLQHKLNMAAQLYIGKGPHGA